MTRLRLLARDGWAFMRGYWVGEERWAARSLLISIVSLNLGLVFVNVLQNKANGTLFTALQQRDASGFYTALASVVFLILLYLSVAVLRVYLTQTLELRWRRWLTDDFVTRWLAHRSFYRMRFSDRVDNPDQRISEDVRLFIERTLSLGLGLLSAMATLGSFAALLYALSGSVRFPVAGIYVVIPGYMLWLAILYSGVGSVLAHLVGRPLIGLHYRQQRVEADFRFSLLRVREEAESIAFYDGEERARIAALGRFGALYENFGRLIVRSAKYSLFQLMCSQFVSVFALLVASPRYFAGTIQLGTLTQTANAFERVNEALSWFIGSYTVFAEWRATADRLIELRRELASGGEADGAGLRIERVAQDRIDLQAVSVTLPDGSPLLEPTTRSFASGETVLLHGASGSGRSTLFRVLAGLWPFARGRIDLPLGRKMLFLPQRPYMPMGSLRDALWFPAERDPERDADVVSALRTVGLPAFAGRLDEEADWLKTMTLGELQRIAIARALLLRPDWLFLDESTSALEEAEESVLRRVLTDSLPRSTIISIGDRSALGAHHARVITVERADGGAGRLVDEGTDRPDR